MNVFLEVGKVLLYVYSTTHTGVDILLCHFFSFLNGVCKSCGFITTIITYEANIIKAHILS